MKSNLVITKDKEEFLKKESEWYKYMWESFQEFRKHMEEDAVQCESCKVWYWKGYKKRCSCNDGNTKEIIERFKEEIPFSTKREVTTSVFLKEDIKNKLEEKEMSFESLLKEVGDEKQIYEIKDWFQNKTGQISLETIHKIEGVLNTQLIYTNIELKN